MVRSNQTLDIFRNRASRISQLTGYGEWEKSKMYQRYFDWANEKMDLAWTEMEKAEGEAGWGEGDSDQEISLGPAEPDMLDIHVKMLRRERDQ